MTVDYEPVDPLRAAAGVPGQQPTHHFRAKPGEITCRSCGALKAHPIHFKDERVEGRAG